MPDKLKDLIRPLGQPAWLCFAWFGLTAGVSLLESPVRFTVPPLTRETAFDVGAGAFNALNMAELVLLILLLVLVRVSGRSRELWGFVAVITLIMIAQTAWLLPELTATAAMIVAGFDPAPSIAPAAYAITQVIKLVTLLWLGLLTLSPPAQRGSRSG